MSFRFSVHLGFLWPEIEPAARLEAAQQAGFDAVEMIFPEALGPGLGRELRGRGLSLVCFNSAMGDFAAGERGIMCLPGREAEFARSVEDAIVLARRLGAPQFNAMVGVVPGGLSRDAARATALANLRRAAPLLEQAGVALVIEPINPTDRPGSLIDTTAAGAALVEAVGSPAVRLELDLYHAAMAGDDLLATIARFRPLLGHVQLADVPGRHQPGTGRQPIAAALDALVRAGYDRHVGLEYRPQGPTEAALDWLPRTRRRRWTDPSGGTPA